MRPTFDFQCTAFPLPQSGSDTPPINIRWTETPNHSRARLQPTQDITSASTLKPPYSLALVSPSNFPPIIPTTLKHTSRFRPSAQTHAQLRLALKNALPVSTTREYKGAVKSFHAFCKAEGVPHSLRWPADEYVLCAFAASYVGLAAGSTVKGYITALKTWHIMHNQPWLGSVRLSYIIKGVGNLAPPPSKRPARLPISRWPINLNQGKEKGRSTDEVKGTQGRQNKPNTRVTRKSHANCIPQGVGAGRPKGEAERNMEHVPSVDRHARHRA